jgi:hypothetical protein
MAASTTPSINEIPHRARNLVPFFFNNRFEKSIKVCYFDECPSKEQKCKTCSDKPRACENCRPKWGKTTLILGHWSDSSVGLRFSLLQTTTIHSRWRIILLRELGFLSRFRAKNVLSVHEWNHAHHGLRVKVFKGNPLAFFASPTLDERDPETLSAILLT